MKGTALLYRHRFSEKDLRQRERVWQVLCHDFFQDFIRDTDTVLDLGSGFGEFIRFIRARRKIAVDFNPDAASYLPSDVQFHLEDACKLPFLDSGELDVCFTSNFFEHLPSKAHLDALLLEVGRVLKPGGILIALQPNIRYAPGEYWDFYDHQIPLSHLSCAEAFTKAGFEISRLLDRFLPFTTCSPIPKHPLLVRVYLQFRPVWRLVGRQFLIVGRKPSK